MKKNPQLIIADPSLADVRGHHFSLSLQVARGAISQGYKVIWFTHKDFTLPIWLKGIQIYPIFSATMYDRYKPEIKNNLPDNLEQQILDELLEGIASSGIGVDDHIYFHTGFGDLYKAIPGFIASSEWQKLPYLHICTPYDLETMPGKDSTQEIIDIFNSLRKIEAVDKKLFFWAETPQLAQHYTIKYGINVRSMPLPPPIKIETTKEKIETFTALYLGAAREEKGFLFLPELVEGLYEPYGRTGKIKFIIQCSPQIIGYLPVIKETIEKLSQYPDSYVQLIDKVLDEESYHSYLLNSDVLLLLYSKKSYKIRGSGIAVEAISANKCILTYSNTFCASLITHGGGSAVENINQAVISLTDMVEKQYIYREKAKSQGEKYRNVNSVEKYVARIINQANKDNVIPYLPNMMIGHISPQLLKMNY